jgi:glycine cleavage system protein P-like pyridoxal-binding family
MSNLGMRIKGDVFEVGFEAETREEFDSFVERLQMVAATIWRSQHEPEPERDDQAVARIHAAEVAATKKASMTKFEKQAVKDWREEQGLR